MSKFFNFKKIQYLILLCSLILSACGGGGGGNSSDDPLLEGAGCEGIAVPQLKIVTENKLSVNSKEEYLEASLEVMCDSALSNEKDLNIKIKGRGNSTWIMPKRPYKIKTNDKISFSGMPAGKEWTLLANYMDKTMLRNELAFDIARHLEMPYTPASVFVELFLNDEYVGVYQLTNKVYEVEEVIKQDLKQLDSEQEQNSTLAFLIEMDKRLDLNSDPGFLTNAEIPYKLRTKHDDAQIREIRWLMNRLEEKLKSDTVFDSVEEIADEMDLDSLIDFYWINEISGNVDGFEFSTYLYKRKGEKLNYGPIWDFDLAFGNNDYSSSQYAHGWYTIDRPWAWPLRYLLKNEHFLRKLEQRGDEILKNIPLVVRAMDEKVAILNNGLQQRNFVAWPILGTQIIPNPVNFDTYEEEVDYLKNWIFQRTIWLRENMKELKEKVD